MVPYYCELPSKSMLYEGLQATWLFSGKYVKDAADLGRGGDETKVGVCNVHQIIPPTSEDKLAGVA